MLLPNEVADFVADENRDFYQRARLDKQNMIPSLQWTGQALYDLANARVSACATEDQSVQLRDLFDEHVETPRLIEAFASLRVPRQLFKFLYRVLVAHCQTYVDTEPHWQIDAATFEAQLALFQRELQANDRVFAQ